MHAEVVLQQPCLCLKAHIHDTKVHPCLKREDVRYDCALLRLAVNGAAGKLLVRQLAVLSSRRDIREWY